MNLDDFKKKAEELTKDFQNNVFPEIKEKTKKAKDNVVEFVGEKIIHKDNEETAEATSAEMSEATEQSPTERVEAEIIEDNSRAFEAAGETEAAADRIKSEPSQEAEAAEEPEEGVAAKSIKGEPSQEAEAAEEPEEGVAAKSIKGEPSQEAEAAEESDEGAAAKSTVNSNKGNSEAGPVEHVTGTVDTEGIRDRLESVKAELLPKVKNTTDSVVDTLSPKVKNAAAVVGETAKNLASVVGGKLKNTAAEVAPKIKDGIKEAAPRVKETLKEAGPRLKKAVKNTADDISFQGYRFKKNAKKKTGDMVKNSIRNALFPDGEVDKKSGEARKKAAADDSADKSEGRHPFKGIAESSTIQHARTVMSHRHLVFEHCVKAGIPLQGLTHDLSKFSPSEFFYGIKFFSGDRSPNEGEREDHGYSNAWMHHKGRNKHHFEYWIDYNLEANKAMPVKMPLKYLIEMFCDRVAASKVYLKEIYTDRSPLQYFEKGRARRNIHPETSDFLEKLLRMLARKGEDYTFMYIRWFMKHHDDY